MADYQARINLLVAGQDSLSRIQRQVEDLEGAITAVERRWRTASAALTRSRTVLGVTGTDLPRGAGGRFAQDPDRQQRINALAAQRQAAVQERIARLTASRTRQEIDNVNTRLAAQERLNRRVENQIALESRLNAAVDLYRTNLRKFERGGGGRQDPALVRNAEAIQEAFAAFEAGGSRNLRLVRSLATELGRVGEAQRELNRAQSLGSKGFEAGRRLQERLSVVAQAGTTSPERVRAARSMATEAISASRSGDQQAYTEAIRRATAATSRLERESRETAAELDAQQRRIARLARLGGPSSPVQGAVDLIGSPINKAMGTKAAVALAQQREKAAADELKALQGGTKSAVALAQQKQQAAADELKALQGGTKAAVSLARQKEKAAADELKALQKGTKDAVALAQQKQKALDTQSKERTGMLQNALIGGAFPMLFGGGAGAVAGGFAGGFIPGNPMMSIVTSALGTVVDEFAAAAAEMGVSLSDPITNFEKLKEANLLASKSQEFYIQKLIETGRIAEATGAIQAQVIKKIGVSGYNDLTALGNASVDLSKAWADFNLQLQAALAGPLAGLLAWLTEIVKLSTASTQQQAQRLDPAAFTEAQMKAIQKTSTFGFGGNAAAYNKELDRLSAKIVEKNVAKIKPLETTKQKDLNTIEAGIKAAEQQADIIKGAYRTGFQLQQQAIDLQRQGTDLQRRVADDIFNKQQQIARLQIDNERQRQQIAIETVDLEYRRRISQEEGRVAEALAAEADLLKTRAQGEANIGNAKRLLELDIAKQQRDTENYVYQLGREIENIRRSTLNYEMQVADYRLDIERKVAAERRIENAGTTSGSPTTSSAKPGATSKQQALVRAANMLGVDPVDLATIISFETGGTFSPSIKGGAGGNYQGLIQFGPNERKTYGASGQQSFEEQITGPVVKYFQSRFGGVGMKTQGADLLTLYRTVLGGNPKASLHAKDAFGTSPASGVERMQKGHRQKAMAFLGGNVTSSTASQLTTAESQVTARPAVPSVDAAGASATLANLNAKDAAIRKEAVTLQEKLNQLQESAALQRLEEVARGPIDLQQRRDAIEYAKADLSVVQIGNSELQDRLAFEAQSLVKLQIRVDRDKEILENTKLQGSERKKLEDALQKGLEITQQQVVLDREALRLAQEKRFAVEEANIQSQLGVTGTGLKAGFIGPAAGAFESEMLKSGNTEQATRLAELTNQLTLAQVQAQGMESSVLAIGDAFGTAMTDGVAGLINGTATAEQVFAEFLNTIAQALLKAAAQMIATYIAIGIAKAFAGMGSSSSGASAVPTDAGGWAQSFKTSLPGLSGDIGRTPIGFAEGGFVSGPTSAVIGEGGESEYVIPASKMQSAMSRYSRGARGEGVIAGSGGGTEGNGGAAAAGPMVVDVRYSVERINDVEYVTASQFQSGMQQAAQQGAAMGRNSVYSDLVNKRSIRQRMAL